MVSETCGTRLRPRPISGPCIRYGRGVPQDDTEAVMWFPKAADQGDAVAEVLLGNQYANGKGVPQDYSEAMIWFQRAAEQGHPVAKLYLGVMYAEGRGVPQDYVRARRHRVSKERSRL